MSDQLKHILIAIFAAVIVIALQLLTNVVPAQYQPFIAAAVAYFTHYYLENAPSGSPLLPGAPPTGPPATISSTSFDIRYYYRLEKSSSHIPEAYGWGNRVP